MSAGVWFDLKSFHNQAFAESFVRGTRRRPLAVHAARREFVSCDAYARAGHSAALTFLGESDRRAEQTVKEDEQYKRRDSHVEPIPFDCERESRERHPRHGGRDQEQESQLDDSTAMKSEGLARDAAKLPKIGRFTLENTIRRWTKSV